jgi:hypothetical protein
MKRKLLACCTGIGLLAMGCSLYENAGRNIKVQTQQAIDACYETKREEALAKIAWEHQAHEADGHVYSKDYARGFKEGFADYLHSGGTGEPPTGPPEYYRTIHYQSDDGVHAVEDWFAGFRHGSRAAMDSGYRADVVVPLSGPVRPPGYHPGEQRGLWDEPAPSTDTPLPPPRPVEPGAPGPDKP